MFGDNIRKLRTMRGLTQKDLADALSFSYQNISKWENDISMPDIPTVLAIANYFGVSVDTLLGNAPKNETLEIPVKINERDDFCLWTDFVCGDTIAPLSELHEGRRRTGTAEKDFAAEPRIRFFLAVNKEHKISSLIAYHNIHWLGLAGRIREGYFYYRPNERASFCLPNAVNKKIYDILVPKDGFLITADSKDHRVRQIMEFILPKRLRYFVDLAGYSKLWALLSNGELDYVDITLEGDAVRLTKPAEYVNPLYDNIDHLTSLVKERVELSFKEYQAEIAALKKKVAELEDEIDEIDDLRCELDDLTERVEALEEHDEEE